VAFQCCFGRFDRTPKQIRRPKALHSSSKPVQQSAQVERSGYAPPSLTRLPPEHPTPPPCVDFGNLLDTFRRTWALHRSSSTQVVVETSGNHHNILFKKQIFIKMDSLRPSNAQVDSLWSVLDDDIHTLFGLKPS
jgi:hypothetical protein